MSQDVYPFQNVPIWVNPERLGGKPCFAGTRLPVDALFTNLEGGLSIDEFLDCFPSVTREQVVTVLDFAGRALQPPAA